MATAGKSTSPRPEALSAPQSATSRSRSGRVQDKGAKWCPYGVSCTASRRLHHLHAFGGLAAHKLFNKKHGIHAVIIGFSNQEEANDHERKLIEKFTGNSSAAAVTAAPGEEKATRGHGRRTNGNTFIGERPVAPPVSHEMVKRVRPRRRRGEPVLLLRRLVLGVSRPRPAWAVSTHERTAATVAGLADESPVLSSTWDALEYDGAVSRNVKRVLIKALFRASLETGDLASALNKLGFQTVLFYDHVGEDASSFVGSHALRQAAAAYCDPQREDGFRPAVPARPIGALLAAADPSCESFPPPPTKRIRIGAATLREEILLRTQALADSQ